MRVTLSRAVGALAAIILALFAAATVSDHFALTGTTLGGKTYRSVSAVRGLLSAVSEQTLSLTEASVYLQAEQASSGAASDTMSRLAQLRKDHAERKTFWTPRVDAAAPADSLTRAVAQANDFWEEVEKGYSPALERKDRAALAASASKLATALAAYRRSVNELDDSARTFFQSAERFGFALKLASAAFLLAALFVARRIISPIQSLASYAERLSRESLAEAPPGGGEIVELERMSAAVSVFRDTFEKIRRAEEEAALAQAKVVEQQKDRAAGAKWYIENRDFFFKEYTAAMERLSAGDLEVRIEKEFIKDYEQLRAAFNRVVERMQSTMQGIMATCGAIDRATGEVSKAAENLSQRNETQAATLAETAAAVDKIVGTVRTAADSAGAARQMVGTAKADALNSEKIVTEAIAAMGEIEKSSEQIGQIIGVINEIAFQTNLLALNAGVEAARAGEAGRGFAVVATEVRALAQRSAEAAKEIKELISASSGKVHDGVSLVAETGASLRRILSDVARINDVVNEIASGAEAQSTSLREVNTAVQEIDHVTQENAAMAQEMNAASRSLAGDSAELVSLVGRFRIGEMAATAAPLAAKKPALIAARPVRRPLAVAAAAVAPRAQASGESWEEL